MLAICALLAVTTAGCDQLNKVKGLFSKKEAPPAVPPHQTVTPPPAQTPARGAATPGAATHLAQRPQGPVTPVRDHPYSSPDTGTVAPGMSESQVYALWGAPVAVRHAGPRTYLFFPNGCERSCGTADVVTLDNGSVVDAIVRWYGHGYSGMSSSPKGGRPTGDGAAGTTLQMPDTTKKDTTVTPAPAPAPVPADTIKPKPDSLKPKPDSSAADSTKQKPDSTH
jgi:hypothetical protein